MMKRFTSIVLMLALLLALLPLSDISAAPADLGSVVSNMPTGELLFLTLYNDGASPYRWNASGTGAINSDIHLYDATGENCTFRLTHVENEWYGIKFIKNNGTDRYVDVADKSKDEGKVLHIWESSDSKLSGNAHRQFAFYSAGTDRAGNPLYYIKIRHSGMWVGLKDNTVGSQVQLVQTSTAARKWYVTPCTVPMQGGEVYPWTQTNGLYFELFAKNSMQSVSVKGREGNIETDGMGLNVYTIGQSSRWMLSYNKTYKAYEIASTQYETQKGISLTGKVWDVSNETANTDLNVWSQQSKALNENTSQLWRFIANADGSYKIYNARTGQYVCLKDSTLTQGERANCQDFLISYLSTNASANYGNVFDLENEDLNWMKALPDTVLLSEVNIPATHNTGANAVIQDMNSILDNASVTKCQKHYYEEQLATGVRSFDVRCNAKAENTSVHDVSIVHGGDYFQCYNRYGAELSLGEILDISKLFLQKHPSETIVILIKPDAGTHTDLARTLAKYVEGNKDYFWLSDTVPTMRQARGKMVLLRRFEDSTNTAALGPDLTKWDDQDYGAVKGLLPIPQASGAQVYVQDAYQQTGENKINYVQGAIQDSASIAKNAYIYNYTSCTLGFVIDTTRVVNAWLYQQALQGKRLGMVMMNYSDSMMCRKIYQSNVFPEPYIDETVQIQHSLNLASDISINFTVKTEQLAPYDSYYLRVNMPIYEGNTLTGTRALEIMPTLKGGYYYFTLDGLNSLQMNNVVEATLYMKKDGKQYLSNVDRYSVATYAYNQLNKEGASDSLKKLCANLLQYGAAAQIWKSYRTDALVDADLTQAHRAYLTNPDTVVFGNINCTLDDLQSPSVPLIGKALRLDSKVIVRFIMDATNYDGNLDDLSLRVSYVNIHGETKTVTLTQYEVYHAEKNYYAFNFDVLLAAELRSVLSAAVYEGDTQLSKTMQYSVDTYGNNKTGTLLAVCKAMIAYADAAFAFFS